MNFTNELLETSYWDILKDSVFCFWNSESKLHTSEYVYSD